MSLKLKKRTRSLACLLPGVRSSTRSLGGSKGQWLKDESDYSGNADDDRSHLLMSDIVERPESKAYNLEKQQEEEVGLHPNPLNDTVSSDGTSSRSSTRTPRAPSDSASTGSPWPGVTLELDQSMNSVSSLPSSLKSMSLSAPNSPFLSTYSSATTSSLYSLTTSSQGSSSPTTCTSAPVTPTRTSRLPLTSPLPRRRPSHKKSNSASNIMLPMALAPPPCEQVQNTLSLLKSIKNQIKAMKRRESHLSTKLHVQRRERQQMQEQIAHLESRRLRVEAMFVRPLPLILLLPAREHEYDLCLVSEGQDAWNALEPLIRIQLVPHALPERLRKQRRPLLLHFSPTLTQPMATVVSALPAYDTCRDLDLQPLIQQMDFAFWDRVTCGQVLEADWANQLSTASCQFLFDALMEQKHLWKDQLMVHVVDKKTRRFQWILQPEADALYYDVIPSSPSAPVCSNDSDWEEED